MEDKYSRCLANINTLIHQSAIQLQEARSSARIDPNLADQKQTFLNSFVEFRNTANAEIKRLEILIETLTGKPFNRTTSDLQKFHQPETRDYRSKEQIRNDSIQDTQSKWPELF